MLDASAEVELIYTWSKSQIEERKEGVSSFAEHEHVKAIAGAGLEGDRYAKKGGLYSGLNFTCQQVTLFDIACAGVNYLYSDGERVALPRTTTSLHRTVFRRI